MARVQQEAAKPPRVAAEVMRPRQAILVMMLLAYGAVVALVVVGALRSGEVLVAWLGVAFAVVLLPVVEFYRRAIAIEPGGLVSLFARTNVTRIVEVLRERAPRAGQIDPARDRVGARLYIVLGGGVVLIALGLAVLGITLPRTLEGQRLFSEAAALGLIAGLVLGTMIAPLIVPKAPIAVVGVAMLAAMVLVPAAALFANMALRAPLRTTGLTVLERKAYADDRGRVAYRVDVDIDRVRHRLSPTENVGRRLEQGKTFDICVRDGVLGHTVILSYTYACGDATHAAQR